MSAECGNKWTKEVVDSLSASYEIGEQGVDLNEALELCIPAMEQLCAGDCPDDWLLYSYEYLRTMYFPENFSVEKGEVRGQSVRFYVAVLNQLFERERKTVLFDPVRDYALLEESEMKYTRIRDEYERFLQCVKEEGVYAFMRLSKLCTPYQTLGHIAGVHHVAMYMARQLIHTEIPVDLGLMSGAALMHDIGKFGCRPSEGRRVPYLHYYYTYQYCERKKLENIGEIASNHSVWDLELENLSVESLLLIYADFRVKSVYDEQKKEHIRFWSLKDSYQVILEKLDNVDEKKRKRYARVYARLKDFEEYLIRLGCQVDLKHAYGSPQKENYVELMKEEELIGKMKALAIESNLRIMEETTREDRFIEFLEHIRSQRDGRQVRAYLTAIEEYSEYLPQNQKKVILKFLMDMMSHKDGDIRRQAARIAGILIAKYEICFTKEVPEGYVMPSLGESQENCFYQFLNGILNPGVQVSEQEKRHAGYAMKTAFQTLLQNTEEKRHKNIIQIYLEYCLKEQDELSAFLLLDAAAQIPVAFCSGQQQEMMEKFVLCYLRDCRKENQIAALRLLLLWMQQGWRCSVDLSALLDTTLPNMKREPYCIQFLAARIREFYGVPSEIGMRYYDMANLYMENQRAEIPWIYKHVNLEILKQRQRCEDSPEQLYQYASHLLNMLQFSGRVVNRLQAGQNLLEIFPMLLETQRYEIVLELVRALEIGEYAVSKYIPPYLGQIFHMLEEHEQLYVLNQMQYLLESQEKQTVLAGLETAGAILKYAPGFMESAKCERLTGFLCMGMASDQMEVSQEAFYIAGHDLFGQNESGSEQKSVFFQMLARKILSLLNWNKLGVYAYFYGAALNHIYRFIDDYVQETGKTPLIESKKPVAFFPGTFDPFSLGHKQIVKEIASMGYRIYLAVDEFSWSKRTQPFEVRRQILSLSVADLKDVYLFPEEIPINIANPRDLEKLCQAMEGVKPWIVVGSDVICNASAYRKQVETYSIHSFPHLIFYRNQEEAMEQVKSQISGECRFVQLPAFYEDVSSTRIRENVNAGRDISGLVDTRAQNYIYRQGLYSVDSVYKKTASYTPIESNLNISDSSCSLKLQYEDEKTAEVCFHSVDMGNLLCECRNMEEADALRSVISGSVIWMDRVLGDYSEYDDRRLTVLNEALEYFQEQNVSYALCRPEKSEKEMFALHGFVPVKGADEIYYVDLKAPLVIFYDTPALLKEELAKSLEVKGAVRRSHIRLLAMLSKIYPGKLLLCFESGFLNYRLLKRITEENGVSLIQDPQRRNGEKMCVPFGKILKGVRVPNTVTKELETEKLYKKDLSEFVIKEYQGYASLPVQLRTIRSFDRQVILVDDLFHTGHRMKELGKHMKTEGVVQYQLLTGVLSGRGRDLAKMQGLDVQYVYTVPNLGAWLIESDLYPFLGGDGVECMESFGELCPSVNPILPYAAPQFLEGISREQLYDFSAVCLENARDICRAAEKEYARMYGRRLTLDRMMEILLQPRCPDGIMPNEARRMQTPSQIIEEELMKLRRIRGKGARG